MAGVDRSPRMLAVAQERMVRSGRQSPLILGDGRALPVQDKRFDTLIATFPAGYILTEETLNEAHRVLRDGGRLVIVGLWVELRLNKFGRLLPVFYGRPTLASLDTVLLRMAAAGFQAQWAEQHYAVSTVGVLVAVKTMRDEESKE
jgi:SAM-dependent methyltransferase